ncbi:MAG: site-specific integrase [Chitinophagia bacterium]|nr:site-specific integrase [Chitinophagia bacterium]
MPKVKLNQMFTDSISVSVGKSKNEWFDISIKGFYLEVRASGGKTWRLRLMDRRGDHRVISLGDAACVSYQQAKDQAIELRAAAQLGKWFAKDLETPKHQTLSFSDFVELHYLPSARIRKRSIESEMSFLKNHLLPYLGEIPLNEVSRLQLAELHNSVRQRGYAPATADRLIVLVRHIFNQAIKLGFLEKGANPAEKFDFFNIPNGRERFLTPQEVSDLMNSLRVSDNPDLIHIVSMLLLTGCRRGEILNSRWVDIDFEKEQFRIPVTKQGKPHTLPLTENLKALIGSLPSKNKSAYLFPNPRTGKPYKSFFYSWDRARKSAGMPELRIHDLRHSFASFLVNNGRTLYEVQRLLGHSSSKTTQRYAHLTERSLSEAMSVAGAVILDSVD